MSWKYEVATYYRGEETWNTNACRFATKEEAEAAGRELLSRWLLPHAHRAVETPDEPRNYVFDFDIGKPVPVISFEAEGLRSGCSGG